MEQHITRRDLLHLLGCGTLGCGALAAPALLSAKEPAFPKGAIIRTLLKDLPPSALAGGATLFHEHLSLAPDFMPRWMKASGRDMPASSEPFFMQDLALMTAELKAAAQSGVACIVDGGHDDMGRDLAFLKQLAAQSGMPIVASCGYYAQPFYPPKIATMTEDEIFADLVHTARTQPMGALGEIGTWDVMTADEKKVFRAVGRAHLATNLPIFTHTNFGKGAVEQLDVLQSVGVKPQRVVIGHIGGLADPQAMMVKELCKRGAFVGYDRQGGAGDARNVAQVQALIEAGYAANLMFASDFSSAAQTVHNHQAGYAKTLTVFVPKLREAGVKEDTLHQILVDNPRRFLAFVPKNPR
jgi:phosphotriesterase-related protein